MTDAQNALKTATYEGSTRAYETALAHSARVRRLKILLPILALLISLSFIAVSFVRAFLPENVTFESAKIENGKVVMEKPAISGRNADGVYYSMTAERALQDIKSPNEFTLENIRAVVPAENGLTARVNADSAMFDQKSEKLDMPEPFVLNLSNGIKAEFLSAAFDAKLGRMTSKEQVAITAREASIVADSLEIEDKGMMITFEGNVRVTIDPASFRDKDG